MKVIVAGSREIRASLNAVMDEDVELVEHAVKRSGFDVTEVVSGMAHGPDMAGMRWAERHGIPVRRFPANWDLHGKRAGYLRNIEMAHYADALIAIWNGRSAGTKHMISYAKSQGIDVFVQIADHNAGPVDNDMRGGAL